MKFAAFIRGINVGGNSIVSMTTLKKACEEAGLTSVETYINSGNIIFESNLSSIEKLESLFEDTIQKEFHINTKVVVLTKKELEEVILKSPKSWSDGSDVRCYIAFLKAPTTSHDVEDAVKLTKDVDTFDHGKRVVYMTTKMTGLTKSGFTKLIGTKIYKEITMRNVTTVRKVVSKM